MSRRGGAVNGTASSGGDPNHPVSLRAKRSDCQGTNAPGCATTGCAAGAEPRSHRRRWSIDLSRHRTSEVVTVRKNKREPPPPQRGVSLPQPPAATSTKRYSCPPMGIFPGHSSSSSSSTSSCSSPPPVKTSVITGRDPLGWKLQPKSGAASSKARANRLSLQIPLPTVPVPDSPKPRASPGAEPASEPKLHRRYHSDTSALVRTLEAPAFAVTLDELHGVQLHPIAHPEEPDDVFLETSGDCRRATDRPGKIPPTVPEKTAVARQIAQLIARSHQRWRPVRDNPKEDEPLYSSVMKAQPKTHRAGQ
ncbi:protein transport protein sec31-like [Salarias fasciatus]|uniref:protein transport protein sec31-like n=1 Tax=Salarias fasciatus TaxID=181472 RepID=UPI0011768494|nr:protein transport protein sec31-like [Salarias fasciatus]XP_029954347.1 protein transport protein sec31-like [Salarias fasciatus]